MSLMWPSWPGSALRHSAEDKHRLSHTRKEAVTCAIPQGLCTPHLPAGPAQPPGKESGAEAHGQHSPPAGEEPPQPPERPARAQQTFGEEPISWSPLTAKKMSSRGVCHNLSSVSVMFTVRDEAQGWCETGQDSNACSYQGHEVGLRQWEKGDAEREIAQNGQVKFEPSHQAHAQRAFHADSRLNPQTWQGGGAHDFSWGGLTLCAEPPRPHRGKGTGSEPSSLLPLLHSCGVGICPVR